MKSTNAHAATVAAKSDLGITPSYKDAGVSPKIVKLARDYKEAQLQAKKFDALRKDLSAEILVELSKAGLNARPGETVALAVGPYRLNAIASHNSTISKEKLLEACVPAETIVECTVESPYEYITVTDVVEKKVAQKERKAGVKSISSAKKKARK